MNLLSGNESFTYSLSAPNKKILDFWSWNSSDLLNNTLRGALAEYIVALAMDIDLSSPRQDWTEYDLITSNGIKIEVKCSAYLQSWKQLKLSEIRFGCSPSQVFADQKYAGERIRHSDIYVFCVFECQDPEIANPMNLDQWTFYIIPTKTLDEKLGEQKTISLQSLLNLSPARARFHEISAYISSLAPTVKEDQGRKEADYV